MLIARYLWNSLYKHRLFRSMKEGKGCFDVCADCCGDYRTGIVSLTCCFIIMLGLITLIVLGSLCIWDIRTDHEPHTCSSMGINSGIIMVGVGASCLFCQIAYPLTIWCLFYTKHSIAKPRIVVFYSNTLPWSKYEAEIFGDNIYCVEDLEQNVDMEVLLKKFAPTYKGEAIRGVVVWLSCHDDQAKKILSNLHEFHKSYLVACIVLNTCYSDDTSTALLTEFPIISIHRLLSPVSDRDALLVAFKLYKILINFKWEYGRIYKLTYWDKFKKLVHVYYKEDHLGNEEIRSGLTDDTEEGEVKDILDQECGIFIGGFCTTALKILQNMDNPDTENSIKWNEKKGETVPILIDHRRDEVPVNVVYEFEDVTTMLKNVRNGKINPSNLIVANKHKPNN